MNSFDVDFSDYELLHVAVIQDAIDVVRKLLVSGADPNAIGDGYYDCCLITLAMHCRNFEMMRLLIENGADVNHRFDGQFESALHCARRCDLLDFADYLIANGAKE